MIVFYNASPGHETNVDDEFVYQSGPLSVYSLEKFFCVNLNSGGTLFFWGKIYEVSLSDGSHISPVTEENTQEVLGNLFAVYPLDQAIEKIEGSFVGLLVEAGKTELFGDIFNTKEIFYYHDGDRLVASTGIKSIICQLDVIKYSQAALASMLSVYNHYVPKKHTIYSDIKRLGVGERFVLEENGFSIVERSFYPSNIETFSVSEHEQYYQILKKAVEIRSSPTLNWVFMSSGWDSSALLALLVDAIGSSKVRCIIGRMKYSERAGVINQFELERACKLAEYFGVQINQVDFDLTGNESLESWKGLVGGLKDQHLYAASAYNFNRLAEYVSQHGSPDDAVFAGEISDGIHNLGFSQFATILEHPDRGFREYSDKMASYLFGPTFLESILNNSYGGDFVYQALMNRLGAGSFFDASALPESEKKIQFLSSFFHRNCRVPFFKHTNSRITTKKGAGFFENEMNEMYLKDVAENLTPETVYSCLLHLYNSYHWQGGTVRSMGIGIQELIGQPLSLPYRDSRLFQFLSKMPENWGRGLELLPTKYPLKKMLQDKVDYPHHLQTGPHSYLYDVNPQFSHTSEFLFGSALKPYFHELVSHHPYEAILDPAYFRMEYINGIVDRYVSGEEFGGSEMSDLLSIVNLCLVGWY